MSGLSRRSFTRGVLGAGIGLTLEACGSGAHSGPRPSPYSGDLRTVALAAALENQAVSAYQAVQAALHAGRFGPAVPALTAFVRAAVAHHTQHADTWNAILREAREPVVTGAPLSGHAQLMRAIKAASNLDAVVAAVQHLENQAAQTYTAAAGSLASGGTALTAAATIAPVEAMHAAALGSALGRPSGVLGLLGATEAVPATELTV
ncbi:ferritin-like domain-containing protein [Kitasatospora sp. NPDC052896]|uniref:ferritin-like domain-containing protein n=1 Tax=Kitasatospora sp. NPDC052896 TaxID=3364061 RepID=UPI0037C820E6